METEAGENQIDEEIKIFIVVIIHYCSKRIENEDIIFHTNDIAIIEKEQLHLSSNKVLIQISKSNNTIYHFITMHFNILSRIIHDFSHK